MEQIPGDDPDSFDPSGKRITKMRICKEGNGLWATTHYEAVLQDPFWAVVCCRLETGRLIWKIFERTCSIKYI